MQNHAIFKGSNNCTGFSLTGQLSKYRDQFAVKYTDMRKDHGTERPPCSKHQCLVVTDDLSIRDMTWYNGIHDWLMSDP